MATPYEPDFDRGCRMCMQPLGHGPKIKEPDRQLIHGKKDLVHLWCALRTMPFHVEKMLGSLTGADAGAAAARGARRSDDAIDRATIARVVALWREVVGNPDDDGPRLVLADVLHELGDPRAELITLQMLDADRFDRVERIDALIEQHGNTWLWKLYALAQVARFERGFLARLELSDRVLRHDDHDAALGTVLDLLPGAARGEVYKKLVMSPAMVSLRRIEVWDDDSLEAFEQTSARLVGVACRLRLDAGWHAGLANLGERFLRAAARCTTLRELAVEFGSFERVAQSACFRQLERIAVANHRDALALWYRIPAGMTFAVVDAATLPPIEDPPGELSLVRAGARVTARLSGHWLHERTFERLPDGVTDVVLQDAPEPVVARLRPLAAARKLDLVVVETPLPTGIWRSAWG